MRFLNKKKFETLQKYGKGLIGIIIALPIIKPPYDFINEIVAEKIRSKENARIEQLSTYSNFGAILDEYRDDIQPEILKFNLKYLNEFRDYEKKHIGINDLDSFCEYLIEKNSTNLENYRIQVYPNIAFKNSQTIYYSRAWSSYKKIHDFFEMLGLLADKNVVDFDLIFNLFSFPGRFKYGKYNPKGNIHDRITENALLEMNECISTYWFGINDRDGENDSLLDFGSNTKKLAYNYAYKRLILRINDENNEADKKEYLASKNNFTECKGNSFFINDKNNNNKLNRLYEHPNKIFDLFQVEC